MIINIDTYEILFDKLVVNIRKPQHCSEYFLRT